MDRTLASLVGIEASRVRNVKVGVPLRGSITVLLMLVVLAFCASKLGPASGGGKSIHIHASKENGSCPLDWLQRVASHSIRSYVLEDVLRQHLASKGCFQEQEVTLTDILFVVMCATDNKQRVQWMHETWLQWIPPQNLVLLSDGPISEYNMTVLPSLPADTYIKRKYPNATNYEAANLRDLASIQWLGKVNTAALCGIQWIFMVDDDTFVNPPMLLQLLRPYPFSLPLVFAHIWDAPQGWPPPITARLAWPSGGGGMLMSKVAYKRFASALFGTECEIEAALNDVTLGVCSRVAHVVKVHSPKFKPELEAQTYSPSLHDVGGWVTQHRAKTREQMLTFTCIVSKRYGLKHPLCNSTNVVCDPVCHMPS